ASGAADGEGEALRLFRELGDRFGVAIGLLHLGQIGLYLGEDDEAHAHLEEGLATAREIEDQEIEGECELVLGKIAFEAGDEGAARQRFARSLVVCREAGDKRGEANALRWLGKADLESGDTSSAARRLGDALRAFRAFEMWEELLGCLEDEADLARIEGDTDRAAGLLAAAALSRDRLHLLRAPRIERHWQAQIDALRRHMSGAEFDAAWAAGRTWEVDQAIRSASPDRGDSTASA
ncbi:MAG: hypothetical protein ACREXI_01615, partial [Caldimonas sp.]